MAKVSTESIVAAYHDAGTINGAATLLGIAWHTANSRLKKSGHLDPNAPMFTGRFSQIAVESKPLPQYGFVKRYILTSAQNNTKVNSEVLANLEALAHHYNAEILVGTYSYNKASYGKKSTKRGKGPTEADAAGLWYAPEIVRYIQDEPIELAPGLVWRGEMNILPTAIRPLTGLESYTGRKSGIFPHAKLAMTSVPSGKNEPTKFNYTTGTVTLRNYIQKKEGLKAEFHHVYGAVLVEVDDEGNWFVRQLNADKEATIYDLDTMVEDGVVSTGHRVESIVWGDIHEAEKSPEVCALAWGTDGMLDTLQPEYQCFHDLLDFRARNGHTAKKNLIHDRYRAYCLGHDSVEEEIRNVSTFLSSTNRPWCQSVVVDSNHDNFMMEWLRIGDYRADPVNAIYFLETQLHVYKCIQEAPKAHINLLEWAVGRFGAQRNARFLNEDESFVLSGVEHGMHGHLGPNGARGSAANLARMGMRITRGHEHACSIHDGVFTAGVTGNLDQGYNKGPSSWSASHVVQYPNGKRTIVTMWNGKWRA